MYSSSTVAPVKPASWLPSGPAEVEKCSAFAFTASASNASPSLKVTSSRRTNVIFLPSSENSHDSASIGTYSSASVRRINVS